MSNPIKKLFVIVFVLMVILTLTVPFALLARVGQ
jgi:heme/copper-type cytochrome/quinol oxidase subunit 4